MSDQSQRRAIFITSVVSGIGRATALLFAERGSPVGGYDVDEEGLATLETAKASDPEVVRQMIAATVTRITGEG